MSDQKLKTLKTELNLLISRHSLVEVLDRMCDLVNDESALAHNQESETEWNQLIVILERATQAALALANTKKGEQLWS